MGELTHKTQMMRIGYYNGTIESVKELMKRLNLESEDLHYNFINETLFIHSKCLLLQKGDCYQYIFKEEKNADERVRKNK